MTDARRARWIAFDAHFLNGSLGVGLMDRFGPVGITLFIAFLCACKKNEIQGEITFGTDAEALAQMGLSGLELVNAKGEPFDLQTFWRWLGDHKQTARRRRGGRLVTVRSTKWTKWQRGYERQKDADRKGRSRAENTADNTADDAPPLPGGNNGRSPAVAGTETETDSETDKSSSSSDLHPARPPSVDDDDNLWKLVAQRKLAGEKAAGRSISNERAWLAATARNAAEELAPRARELNANFLLDQGQLADALNGNTNILRSAPRR